MVAARVVAMAARSDRPDNASGIVLSPIKRQIDGDLMHYDLVTVEIDREERNATITLNGPEQWDVPADTDALTDLDEYRMC